MSPSHDVEHEWLTPGEMASRSGVSLDALRYYEREGVLGEVARAGSGHRRYSAADVGWVDVIRCLRLTGMSIEQLRVFVAHGDLDRASAQARLDQLLGHRRDVESRIRQMHEALTVIDQKITAYTAKAATPKTPRPETAP